jgi:1,4-alpha-glucan branching enzyme
VGQTVIYEAHVKGLTYLHPDLPEEIRGTYKALGHPVMIDYFKRLGITALELLPVAHLPANRGFSGWAEQLLGLQPAGDVCAASALCQFAGECAG